MIVLPIDQVIADYCEKTHDENREYFAVRGKFDGDRRSRIYGMIGECMVKAHFGLPATVVINHDGSTDGGVDMLYAGLAIDIKTVVQDPPSLPEHKSNITKSQHHDPNSKCTAYILAALNKGPWTVTIAGWILKASVFPLAILRMEGDPIYADSGRFLFNVRSTLYELRNDQLMSAEGLKARK